MHAHINLHEIKVLCLVFNPMSGKGIQFVCRLDGHALKGSTSPLLFRRYRLPLKIHAGSMTGRTKQSVRRRTHRSMLMAQRLRMLAVHIITSRVTKMSQWILLKRHSPTTQKRKNINKWQFTATGNRTKPLHLPSTGSTLAEMMCFLSATKSNPDSQSGLLVYFFALFPHRYQKERGNKEQNWTIGGKNE